MKGVLLNNTKILSSDEIAKTYVALPSCDIGQFTRNSSLVAFCKKAVGWAKILFPSANIFSVVIVNILKNILESLNKLK